MKQHRRYPILFLGTMQGWKDTQKSPGLSPQDAAIFCNALALESTDVSWHDDWMDDNDPLNVGHC